MIARFGFSALRAAVVANAHRAGFHVATKRQIPATAFTKALNGSNAFASHGIAPCCAERPICGSITSRANAEQQTTSLRYKATRTTPPT